MPIVELRECYYFTCEECGRDVLVYGMPLTQALMEQVEDLESDEIILMLPSQVSCPYCCSSFDVKVEINLDDD